jgi:hypothetical protein
MDTRTLLGREDMDLLRAVGKLLGAGGRGSDGPRCVVCQSPLTDAESHVDPMGRPYSVCKGGHRSSVPSWVSRGAVGDAGVEVDTEN